MHSFPNSAISSRSWILGGIIEGQGFNDLSFLHSWLKNPILRFPRVERSFGERKKEKRKKNYTQPFAGSWYNARSRRPTSDRERSRKVLLANPSIRNTQCLFVRFDRRTSITRPRGQRNAEASGTSGRLLSQLFRRHLINTYKADS